MSAAAPATHTPEWYATRSKGIGASEVATIAGVGRWGSRWRLWAEKTGRLEPDPDEATEAMRMGQRIEGFLAEVFAEETGLVVAGEQTFLSHPEHPWCRATVDGMVFESAGATCSHEIDRALGGFESKHDNGAPWTTRRCDTVLVPPELHDIPIYYEAQAQWQMWVAGWERVWFGVLHGFGRYRIYEVARDDEAIAALFDAASQFWHDHVLADVAPALGGPGRDATAAALSKVFGEGGGGEVDVSDLAEQVASLRYLKREAKALDEQIVDLSNVVKAALGEAEVGLVGGRVAVTWKKGKPRQAYTVAGGPGNRTLLIKETK